MKLLLQSLFISWFTIPATLAQTTARVVVDLPVAESFLSEETTVIPIALSDVAPFLAYSVEWEATPDISLQIRFYESNEGAWGDWQALEPDPHSDRKAPGYVSQLGFAPAASTDFSLRIAPPYTKSDLFKVRCHFFNPGKSSAQAQADHGDRAGCPCPQPNYLDRLGWCPSGNCPIDPTPQPTVVTHLIVHHSAGSNSSSDWSAVVRSIWDYHVNVNGWDDIGYNWLIDPNGVLYEGRGNDLQGAHFCGTNAGTMGICMLGTFTSVVPSNQSVGKLEKLLAWKCCDRNIDPEDFSFHPNSGLNLFNISGHRDGICSTECPGDSLYARLPLIRTDVKDSIDACLPSSTNEKLDLETATQVFPNPARDVLYIQLPPNLPGSAILRLFDPQGRVVWQSGNAYQGGELITLSIKGWPTGWYSLQVGQGGPNVKVLIQ
ncbi:MAG: N-acetylmuramoyl-L-alanine amidase [Saprospirales bacterium]|nr:N-acetylmuramoyl-L-alanine amidase [Saprospirales bacterium]